MGLLSECKFCHHFFSSARMTEHVLSKHGLVIRGQADRSQVRARSKTATAPKPQANQPAQSRAHREHSASRRLREAEQSQKIRVEQQARRNQATAAFIIKSAQQKANIEPLSSVWKEQVAKLKGNILPSKKGRLQDHGYSLHMSRVPARSVPAVLTLPPLLHGSSTGTDATPHAPTTVDVTCSCGGENERCFRCDGKGYYEVSAEKAARMSSTTISAATRSARDLAGFVSDPRGAAYGVRELGCFASAPIHDDFSDESSS